MKKILFLLLLCFAGTQAQTYQNPTFGTVTTKTAPTVTTTPHLGTVETNGVISKINPSNLPISTATQTALDLKANKDTGLLSGGVISVNADPTKWNLAAGNGYVTNSLTGVTVAVSWIAQNALTTPFLNTSVATYVLIDENGLKVLQNTPPTQQQFRTHIYLGKLAHTTLTTILFAVSEPSRMFDVSGQITDLNRFLGSGNVEGNIISANGANLNIDASAGMTYRPGANYTNDRNSPSITTEPAVTAASFRRKYRNGSGGWTAVNSTTIDPNFYDNGSGTLIPVPNNKWTVPVFWRFGGTGTIHVDYGQVVYDNKVDALAAAGKAAVAEDPDNKRDASKRGWLVVQQNTTALNNLNFAEFINADKFGERSAGGSSTATHQSTYLNSTTPQIVTNSTQGALTIKRGSADDTDNVFVVQNGSGANTIELKGNGDIVGNINHNTLTNLQTAQSGVTYGHVTDGAQTISGIKTFSSASNFSTSIGVFLGGSTLSKLHASRQAQSDNVLLSNSAAYLQGADVGVMFGQYESSAFGAWMQSVRFNDMPFPISINPLGGNVAIGKQNASTPLDVNGTITATLYTGGATLTGTPTAPTATAGTNTTQIATTAFVQTATGGYSKYVALVSQSGTSAPTVTVLENTLGFTPTFSYDAVGQYGINSSSGFTANKTALYLSDGFYNGMKASVRWSTSSKILLYSTNTSGAFADNNGYNGNTLEIRVYP